MSQAFVGLKEPRPRMLASEKKMRIFFSTRESMQNDILTKQNFLPEKCFFLRVEVSEISKQYTIFLKRTNMSRFSKNLKSENWILALIWNLNFTFLGIHTIFEQIPEIIFLRFFSSYRVIRGRASFNGCDTFTSFRK